MQTASELSVLRIGVYRFVMNISQKMFCGLPQILLNFRFNPFTL